MTSTTRCHVFFYWMENNSFCVSNLGGFVSCKSFFFSPFFKIHGMLWLKFRIVCALYSDSLANEEEILPQFKRKENPNPHSFCWCSLFFIFQLFQRTNWFLFIYFLLNLHSLESQRPNKGISNYQHYKTANWLHQGSTDKFHNSLNEQEKQPDSLKTGWMWKRCKIWYKKKEKNTKCQPHGALGADKRLPR